MFYTTARRIQLSDSPSYQRSVQARALIAQLDSASVNGHDAVRDYVRFNLMPSMWTEEEEVGSEILSEMMAEGYNQDRLEVTLSEALRNAADHIVIRRRTLAARLVRAMSTRIGLASVIVFGSYTATHVWSYLHRPDIEAWLIVAAPAAALILAVVVLPIVYWLLGVFVPAYRSDR